MTVYELLIQNQQAFKMLASVSVEISDLNYLEMYKEYLKLKNEGHKITYIVQYLSDEMGITDRSIYRIINRLSSEIKM